MLTAGFFHKTHANYFSDRETFTGGRAPWHWELRPEFRLSETGFIDAPNYLPGGSTQPFWRYGKHSFGATRRAFR
jgi:hypothetical protein